MISSELEYFYERWLRKAEEYQSDNLQDCFDRFFTLFVAYNRLYDELALSCAKRGKWVWDYFSDGLAAKKNVQKYLGNQNISRSLANDNDCMEALASIVDLLERRVFKIKLDGFSRKRKVDALQADRFSRGRRVEADAILLKGLKSDKADEKVYAILDIVYSIRCNMFHGQKGYEEEQIKIIVPVTFLLRKIMNLLYEKMSYGNDI